MTPHQLSAVHAAAFTGSRPWSAEEISDLRASPLVFCIQISGGFALGRVVVDECELLTLAVHPDAQRQGIGRLILTAFETESVTRGAARAFLEVAADNFAALALYQAHGYTICGTRPAYYARRDRDSVAATLMEKPIG